MMNEERTALIRAFNRDYTRRIGVLSEGLLGSGFSLAESRLLWELADAGTTTAGRLAGTLGLDAGYVSRLLRGLKERGLIHGERASDDARQLHLSLTAAGRAAFAPLDERARAEAQALLDPLPEPQQQRLLGAMQEIRRLLGAPERRAPFVLRPHRAGDMGWVTSRHGALYAAEYQWDLQFEALVGHLTSRFIEQFDPGREHCWIAERDGVNIGSAFVVQARDERTNAPEDGVAQLRMLLVEPSARGLGLGEALVRECERFARAAGCYGLLRLWTNSVLLAARGLYAKAGYRLVASEPHTHFGHELVGETWELALD